MHLNYEKSAESLLIDSEKPRLQVLLTPPSDDEAPEDQLVARDGERDGRRRGHEPGGDGRHAEPHEHPAVHRAQERALALGVDHTRERAVIRHPALGHLMLLVSRGFHFIRTGRLSG